MTTVAVDTPVTSRSHSGKWYASPAVIAAMGVLGVAFVTLFYRWFLKQHDYSWDQLEDWGHAYVIPLLSGYLIYRRRHEIAATRPEVYWPGLAAVLVGMMSYFFCLVQVKNHMLQGFSVILTLFGIVLLLLGPRMMRWLFLPIAYLALMVTISESIMLTVTFKLQAIAAQGAGILLSIIGAFGWFSVEITGNTLMLVETATQEQHPLNVAEACSGMRMVVAFYALGVAVALLACKHWWQRILLILLAGPVAVLMNVVRVAVLGLLSLGDSNLAAGDAHTLIGTLLLFPSLGLFLGVVWVLNRIIKDETPKGAKAAAPPAPAPAGRWRGATTAAVLTLAILGSSAFGLGAAIRVFDFHLRKLPIYPRDNKVLASIPRETESWIQVGSDRIESAEIVEVLGTENYLNRVYTLKDAPDGKPVIIDFHAAYYTGMIDTVPHVPERCYVGGGLQQTEFSTTVPIPMETGNWLPDRTVPEDLRGATGNIYTTRLSGQYGTVPGSRVRLPRGIGPDNTFRLRVSAFAGEGQSLHAGYFFIANGGTVASADGVRTLAFDLTNDYAYYLKVQFTSTQVESPEELAEVAGDLLSELIGEVMRCVPDWTEVQTGEYPEGNPAREGGSQD